MICRAILYYIADNIAADVLPVRKAYKKSRWKRYMSRHHDYFAEQKQRKAVKLK